MPTNLTCATADPLIGETGAIFTDNTSVSGNWEDPDPLFVEFFEGGGAPLWWKFTNESSVAVILRVHCEQTPSGTQIPAVNFGIARGACGALAIAESNRNVPDPPARDNATPGTRNTLGSTAVAAVVDPGETVWVEVDGYSGDTSDPPTLSSGQRGAFSIRWVVLRSTFYDDIPDFDVLLDNSPSGDGLIASTLRQVGERIYFSFLDDGTGAGTALLYAASCNLDGTGLMVAAMPSTPGFYISTDEVVPHSEFVSDGDGVFFVWQDSYVVANSPGDSLCTPPLGIDYLFRDLVFMTEAPAGTWTEVGRIGQANRGALGSYRWQACASEAQPGIAWAALSYQNRKTFSEESLGICVAYTPGGWSGSDVIAETFETLSINLASGATTQYELDRADFPTGTATPTYSTVWPANLFDVANDDGYPLLAVDYGADVTSGARAFDSFVTVKRIDTGAVVTTFDYNDCTGIATACPLADADEIVGGGGVISYRNAVRLYPRLADGTRYLSTYWDTTDKTAINRASASDFTGTIEYLDGLASHSLLPVDHGPIESYFLDTPRSTYVVTGEGYVEYLDYQCPANADVWLAADVSVSIPGKLYQQRGIWNGRAFIFLVIDPGDDTHLQILRLPIFDNFYVCTIEPETLTGEPVFRARFKSEAAADTPAPGEFAGGAVPVFSQVPAWKGV